MLIPGTSEVYQYTMEPLFTSGMVMRQISLYLSAMGVQTQKLEFQVERAPGPEPGR